MLLNQHFLNLGFRNSNDLFILNWNKPEDPHFVTTPQVGAIVKKNRHVFEHNFFHEILFEDPELSNFSYFCFKGDTLLFIVQKLLTLTC